jgi:tRNA G10  N-methylase Trm11
MMVAEMQRQLLRIILQLQPRARVLADPFAGSGTILLEAMFRGLDAYASDVNPLAILLCKVKGVLYEPRILSEALAKVLERANSDRGSHKEADFPGLEKWFSDMAIGELSALRRAIRTVPNLRVRRFLWVALAETVRQTSRSRTSTYKLHIRPVAEHCNLPTPLVKFAEIAKTNIRFQRRTRSKLDTAGLISGGRYGKRVAVALHDARKSFRDKFDLIVTSPPYGDNKSTVPYGQNSFLPLQWIDLADIDRSVKQSYLSSTYEIDNRSLGGRQLRGVKRRKPDELLQASPSLLAVLRSVAKSPPDRHERILTFAQDMDASLKSIADASRRNAYLIFTLGNRRVANREVPLDSIVIELFASYGVRQIVSLTRRIPSKRMATRNNIANTIRKEHIAIFRKIKD